MKKIILAITLLGILFLTPKSNAQEINITNENFLDYFKLTGSSYYNQSSGIATLTDDQYNQVGNISLTEKINMQRDFTLDVSINLGNKSKIQGGADGMAFGFFNDTPGKLGTFGNGFGIATLKDAFAFKLDTYWNSNTQTYIPADPLSLHEQTYATFVETLPSGYFVTNEELAQIIEPPKNNEFKQLIFSYTAASQTMAIEYDGKYLVKNVNANIKGNNFLSFTIGAGTGSHRNLHQVKINHLNITLDSKDVVVMYHDEEGNDLAEHDTLRGDIGLPFKSTPKNFHGWVLSNTIGNTEGVFTDHEQEVEYIYKHIEGADITVKYVDINGNSISAEKILTGYIDEEYATEKIDINGYEFKDVIGNESGVFTDTAQTITYVYSKKIVPGEHVTVKHVDTSGSSIAPDVRLAGNIDETYSTEKVTINGYELKQIIGDQSGLFTDKPQTVTYIYDKNVTEEASITVRYLDTESNVIAPNVILSGDIGASYNTEKQDIPGYVLKEIDGIESGFFTEEHQTITYIYEKKANLGQVTIEYTDTDGNVLSPEKLLTGPIGEKYSANYISIKGYQFKEVVGNETGVFSATPQTITYVYNQEYTNTSNIEPDKPKKEISKPDSDKDNNLPQLGETQQTNTQSIIFGILLLTVISILTCKLILTNN